MPPEEERAGAAEEPEDSGGRDRRSGVGEVDSEERDRRDSDDDPDDSDELESLLVSASRAFVACFLVLPFWVTNFRPDRSGKGEK